MLCQCLPSPLKNIVGLDLLAPPSYIDGVRTRIALLLSALLLSALIFADNALGTPPWPKNSAYAATSDDLTKLGPTKRVQVPSAEMGKLLVKRVRPEYPEKARSNGIQGTVMLRATISSAGDVIDVAVISGDPSLAKAAIKAAKGWKYKPYVQDGQPVEVETTIQMNFALPGS